MVNEYRANVTKTKESYRVWAANAAKVKEYHGSTMDGYWIGPFPPRMFIDSLMPIADADLEKIPTGVKFELPVRKDKKKLKKHLYKLFEATIKDRKLSPHVKFFIGSYGRPKAGHVQTVLAPEYDIRGKQSTTHESKLKNPSAIQTKKFDWSADSIMIEFKKSSSLDPLYTLDELQTMTVASEDEDGSTMSFTKTNARANRIRGQLAMYAKEAFDHQFRTHAFQLLVFGRRARFIFWDHSGAIVSDSFDYVSNSQMMVEFFWRYNHMTEQDRGRDVSVVEASEGEKKIFTEKVEQFLKDMDDPESTQRRLPHAEETLSPAFPVYKVTIVDDVSGKSEDVLIQRPFFRIHAVLGRATRGYIAYVLSSEELKFLKDTWRIEHERFVAERTLCRILEESGVPNTPRAVYGGDVKANGLHGKTRCRAWATTLTLSIRHHTLRFSHNHRLLEELLYPVNSSTSSLEFVVALRDCVLAIQGAGDLCDLLHRDISIGNVMLSGVGKAVHGILTDWDHAGKFELPADASHQKSRIGTWRFMSIALLRNSDKANDILDDFESLFWVLLYGALYCFDYGVTEKSQLDMTMFDDRVPMHHTGCKAYLGGNKKWLALSGIADWLTFSSPPLDNLIKNIAAEFQAYYNLQQFCGVDTLAVPDVSSQAPSRLTGVLVETMPDIPDLEEQPEFMREKDKAELLKQYEELRAKLSRPSFWIAVFNSALRQKGWIVDARCKDAAPPQTRKQETEATSVGQLASHRTGEQLASQDTQAVERLRKDQEKAAAKTKKAMAEADAEAKAREKAQADANAEAAARLEWENMMSDDDDEKESCIYEEDIESREDPIEVLFSPISSSDVPTHPPESTSTPDVPEQHRSTHTTSTVITGSASDALVSNRSVGSSRLKRDIDEIVTATGSGGEPSLPLPKKSRPKSRPTTAPRGKKTKPSSPKSLLLPQAATVAEAADDAKEGKANRPRRGLRKPRVVEAKPRRKVLKL
ncbi:hypothetical protein BDY19DRAFT_102256 [Irpex rosettiformis]|uniref:Uncharacterized protein n=1 Tax=Irpex rosettiformis TaxID=378272 RepID=A0ACB8U5M3_9APHY|nr:hypothetical protein BDY19DRAFT_102256 [Irpex rosettiformis]